MNKRKKNLSALMVGLLLLLLGGVRLSIRLLLINPLPVCRPRLPYFQRVCHTQREGARRAEN